MAETVQLAAADGFLCPAYVARPEGPPRGAVVVLQEIFGVNAHIRAVTDGYAVQGYLALAPATFQRVKLNVELGYTPADMETGRALKAAVEALAAPGVMADIQAAIDYAAQAGKVALVGYCWGGLLAWRSACGLNGLSAVAPYYGGGMTAAGDASRQPKCPVLCHFGDQDHWISLDSVETFRQAQPRVEVQVYPTDHGFNCDHRASYDAAAATLARERTLAFFARHLA